MKIISDRFYRLYAQFIEKKMYKYKDPNFYVNKSARCFFCKRLLKFTPKACLQYISSTILCIYVTNYKDNFYYYDYFDYETIKDIIRYSPCMISYIKNPDHYLQSIVVKKMPYYLFDIDNPYDDIILEGLRRRWNYLYYLRIYSVFDVSDYVQKEINKMKLKNGELIHPIVEIKFN